MTTFCIAFYESYVSTDKMEAWDFAARLYVQYIFELTSKPYIRIFLILFECPVSFSCCSHSRTLRYLGVGVSAPLYGKYYDGNKRSTVEVLYMPFAMINENALK